MLYQFLTIRICERKSISQDKMMNKRRKKDRKIDQRIEIKYK
jgi:hypothetical protein